MEAALEFRGVQLAHVRLGVGEREVRGVAGGLAERGPDRFEAQGAEADVRRAHGHGREEVAHIARHERAVGNLIRRVGDAEAFAVAFATEARAFVTRAVAAVTVVAHRDGVAVQHSARVAVGMAGVGLREKAQALHAAGFAHVELRRNATGLDELVFAPAPGAGCIAKRRRHIGVVLREVDQADVPAHVLVVDALARGGVALGPEELVAGEREAHVAGGDIVDVALAVREDGNLELHEVVGVAVAAERAFDLAVADEP